MVCDTIIPEFVEGVVEDTTSTGELGAGEVPVSFESAIGMYRAL